MKPSEVIQDAIDSDKYKGIGSNGDFMCIIIKYKYASESHVLELIEEKLEYMSTLYSYLVRKGAVKECDSIEEIRKAQFKFWADFIKELKEKGM